MDAENKTKDFPGSLAAILISQSTPNLIMILLPQFPRSRDYRVYVTMSVYFSFFWVGLVGSQVSGPGCSQNPYGKSSWLLTHRSHLPLLPMCTIKNIF